MTKIALEDSFAHSFAYSNWPLKDHYPTQVANCTYDFFNYNVTN